MTIKIGTIQEMTGNGYELLVDSETRSYVLARFMDGKLVETINADADAYAQNSSQGHMIGFEKTIVA